MLPKIIALKNRFHEAAIQCKTYSHAVKLNYCIENNAGDSFNKYFLKDYFGLEVGKYTYGPSEHYIFCGSILSRANKNSIILGAGLISGGARPKSWKEVVGCRGALTLKILKDMNSATQVKFLGDPGILVREIFADRLEESNRHNFGVTGIIPHFVDLDIVNKIVKANPCFRIIDIRQRYDAVCREILMCDSIVSSSLHGLIFADGLKKKNNWVKFSDKIIGGEFKFLDYYSTTEAPKEQPVICTDAANLLQAAQDADVSESRYYSETLFSIRDHFSRPD